MGNVRSRTTSIFSCSVVAGTSSVTLDISKGKYVSIQAVATESCLAVSTMLDECVSVACNSYTEAAHGFETGLKGTLAAVVACCAAAVIAACVAVACCVATFTLAGHGLTSGERGQFTTSCADLPAGLCTCTNYFAISVTACTFRVATTRALALAGTSAAITDAGTGTHTLTPNGAIPTGSAACSFIIKIDACTYKLATSRALAIAGTVDEISALNSPASLTFTPACADATSGTVTVLYSNCTGPCAVYVADAGIGLFATPPAVTCAGLSTLDAETGVVPYRSIRIDLDVTDSQWVFCVDVNTKD